MAKKRTAKKKATKAAGKKAPAKKPVEPVELVLDAAEEKALDLAESSKRVCRDLEVAVTEAVASAVRKVYKEHGIVLTPPQAQNVSLLLFGD